jgi:hypothetical protein
MTAHLRKRELTGMLNGARKRVKHYGRRRQNSQDSQDKTAEKKSYPRLFLP